MLFSTQVDMSCECVDGSFKTILHTRIGQNLKISFLASNKHILYRRISITNHFGMCACVVHSSSIFQLVSPKFRVEKAAVHRLCVCNYRR